MTARGLSKREGGILAVCLTLIVIYGGYNLFYKPLIENFSDSDDKIKVAEKRLHNNLKIIRKEKSVNEEYEKYALNFKQKASDEQAMTSILSEIESMANQVSLRISDMQPKRVRKIDFYNNFSVTLTVEGEMPVIIKFLYTLQNPPHLFKVDEIYLEKSAVKSGEVKCRLILSKVLIP